MRKFNCSIAILLVLLLAAGCSGKGSSKKGSGELSADTVTVPDTGFTGIKKYYSKDLLVKEVTFRNGIQDGEMKSYYEGGQLNQTIWYENGLREDSARKYYLEGQVFRTTPYKNDTIDGAQIQYYRNGRVKAKLHYIKGFRTPLLEEFTRDGKLIKDYPEIVFTLNDNYVTTGIVRINLELTDKTRKVNFYRGEFTNGVFDTAKIKIIPHVNGKVYLDLRKSGTPQQEYIGIIGAILTDFGNRYLAYKRIELPYRDLK